MKFRHATSAMALAVSALLGSTNLARADVPDVVVSIKPLHSLVAGVMAGVGKPTLLMDGASSPHSFSLKPSQARALEQADRVFWIGEEIETFLVKPVETIVGKGKATALIDANGIRKLPFRDGATFESHDHAKHDDHGHEDHGHKDHEHDEHAHEEHAHEEHGHEEHGHEEHAHEDREHGDHHEGHESAHSEHDAHIWLDPENAKAIVAEVARVLSDADAENADAYRTNAQDVQARLDDLLAETASSLDGLADKHFVVFHDAYQYFETRFGLEAVGALTLNPEITPGADRLKEIRTKLTSLEAACVFAEPQFEPALVDVVIEGTAARSGVIDPLGSALEAGPDQYFGLIRNMAGSIRSCLSESS
ncbi:MAG: zinc ABC transporter substrate-binding protein [Magnetovibrionaceae bacterium]